MGDSPVTIHSTKIQTGPTGKRGPPQKVDLFFRNFSGWTEPIHWVLDRNFRKFWLNGSRPRNAAYHRIPCIPCMTRRWRGMTTVKYITGSSSWRTRHRSLTRNNNDNNVGQQREFYLKKNGKDAREIKIYRVWKILLPLQHYSSESRGNNYDCHVNRGLSYADTFWPSFISWE